MPLLAMISAPQLQLKLNEIKLDWEQQRAVGLMKSGANVFLTGMAGTGKSATLLEFISQPFRKIDVCATTGIAALNLQDQFRARAGHSLAAYTIYRWAGILTGPSPGQKPEEFFKFLSQKRTGSAFGVIKRIQNCEVLIIDEISMLPGAVLDYLDYHFQRIRENKKPFGGIQLIAVGDYLQLPPVAKNGNYDWAFRSQAWQAAGFKTAYLKTIHRQDEPEFIEALNAFRLGHIGKKTAELLANRVKMFVDRKVVRLMTHNNQVDKWNAYQIGEIERKETTYTAHFEGPEAECEFFRKNSITPNVLIIKPGARVMVTANAKAVTAREGIPTYVVNGQCGTVLETGWDWVVVNMDDDGYDVMIRRNSWTFDPQRDDSAKMIQIPLRPAYAMTIHKSQGLTLKQAHIDIRAAREPGQAYVALSRLRSLGGLYLKDWIKGIYVSDAAINFYRNL